jgi:hypothetical protein
VQQHAVRRNCGVNKAAFAVAATVDAIASDGRDAHDRRSAAGFADGYFGAAGLLEFGARMGTIDRARGRPAHARARGPGLIAGSGVTIYPGCKRDLNDCTRSSTTRSTTWASRSSRASTRSPPA